MAIEYNMIIDQGSEYNCEITWTDEGAIVDLSDCILFLTVVTPTLHTEIAYWNSEDDNILYGDEFGVIAINIPEDVTGALPAGRYSYNLEIQDGKNRVIRLCEGSFKVTGDLKANIIITT
jgi:hypothetical protein